MATQVNVNLVALRQVATEIMGLTTEMIEQVQRNATAMVAPAPAGTDSASAKASASISEFATAFLNSAGKTATELHNFALALMAAADQYEAKDQLNALPFPFLNQL